MHISFLSGLTLTTGITHNPSPLSANQMPTFLGEKNIVRQLPKARHSIFRYPYILNAAKRSNSRQNCPALFIHWVSFTDNLPASSFWRSLAPRLILIAPNERKWASENKSVMKPRENYIVITGSRVYFLGIAIPAATSAEIMKCWRVAQHASSVLEARIFFLVDWRR